MSGYGGKRAEEVATCGKQELRKVHCVADRNQENVALQYHSIIIVSVRPTTLRGGRASASAVRKRRQDTLMKTGETVATKELDACRVLS